MQVGELGVRRGELVQHVAVADTAGIVESQRARRSEVTIRAGWVEVVVHPCDLAADVAAAQRARGWTGQPSACGPGCGLPRDPRWRRLTA